MAQSHYRILQPRSDPDSGDYEPMLPSVFSCALTIIKIQNRASWLDGSRCRLFFQEDHRTFDAKIADLEYWFGIDRQSWIGKKIHIVAFTTWPFTGHLKQNRPLLLPRIISNEWLRRFPPKMDDEIPKNP